MYLVSACLAGINCRYDGKNSESKVICELVKSGKATAICPEQLAGLPTPRTGCEIFIDRSGNKQVISKEGKNLTEKFADGAEKTLAIAKAIGIKKAILKSKSPSCGCEFIYDGTFSKQLIKGTGLTAELLIKNHIEVHTENDSFLLNL